MTKQVPWNNDILRIFAEEATLTKEEKLILRTRVDGWSRIQQAHELGMSLSTVDRITKRLKLKYDQIQLRNEALPPRYKNSKEMRKKLKIEQEHSISLE